MHIFDMEGNQLIITNLELALEQAQSFASYRHDDPQFAELDKTLNEYWCDILSKLKKFLSKLKKFKPVLN